MRRWRFHKALLDEWAYVRLYRSNAERRRAFARWLRHYNHRRPCTSLHGLTPMAVLVNNVGGKPHLDRAPQATRDLRALLRHGAALVRMGTACKNRVHAALADRGIGEDQGLWTGPEIARLEREITGLAKPDPRPQALQVLPGSASSRR